MNQHEHINGNFLRGLTIGTALSIPMWVILIHPIQTIL